MAEMELTRRDFGQRAIQSLAFFSLVDTLVVKEMFTGALGDVAGKWLGELDQLGREVKSQKLKQVEWQKKVEELLGRIDLPDFLRLIDFDKLRRKAHDYKGLGALSLTVNFPVIEGIPTKLVFGRQLFALKKGRSIVPHGHDNMATAFLVLGGQLNGRHYERVEDQPEHMVIQPTIDREFGPGGASTISDYKDNVHWFKALTDEAYVFNIHVMGVNPSSGKSPARIYIDPEGEKLQGGLIRARLISHSEADRLYG